MTPCFLYAGFATGNGCGSINFNSGGTIDSYNSSNMTMSGGSPVTQNYQGDLGSNGKARGVTPGPCSVSVDQKGGPTLMRLSLTLRIKFRFLNFVKATLRFFMKRG